MHSWNWTNLIHIALHVLCWTERKVHNVAWRIESYSAPRHIKTQTYFYACDFWLRIWSVCDRLLVWIAWFAWCHYVARKSICALERIKETKEKKKMHIKGAERWSAVDFHFGFLNPNRDCEYALRLLLSGNDMLCQRDTRLTSYGNDRLEGVWQLCVIVHTMGLRPTQILSARVSWNRSISTDIPFCPYDDR